jgi:hypothetical protein
MLDSNHSSVVYISGFSLTRVVMHAVCLLRRPGKAAFFFAGTRRDYLSSATDVSEIESKKIYEQTTHYEKAIDRRS